eukprot:gene20140-22113_t
MANIRVRFRIEYKGNRDDVDTPHPMTIELPHGSSIIDLLNNATHLHSNFGFTTFYKPQVHGDVVTSMCSILNDEEPDMRWIFYSPAQHCLDKLPGHVKLTIGEEIVARYEKLEDFREDQKTQLGLLPEKKGH